MLPVVVCPGCGSLYSLDHMPGKPYKSCAVCHWPFDPASVERKYFDTTDQIMPHESREPMRKQYVADAELARTPVGYLTDGPAKKEAKSGA